MRSFMIFIVAVALLLAACVPAASAGTYTVLSCQDRSGAPAPTSDAAGGWTAGASGEYGFTSLDRCGSASKDLVAIVSGPGSYPIGAYAWWRFIAPADTTIDSFATQYWVSTRPFDGRNEGAVFISAPLSGVFATYLGNGYWRQEGWAGQGGLHEPYVEARAQCDGPAGSPDCDGDRPHAEVHVERSEITLADAQPPTAGEVSGSAREAGVWRGLQTLAFHAADRGGGVYQARLDVDGVPARTWPIDDSGGHCVDSTGGQRVFRYPRPCPPAVDAVLAVDAGTLTAGDHDVTLRISDAAGNLGTVYSARKTIIAPESRIGPGSDPAKRGAANGENAADDARLTARWTRTRRSALTGPYGRRQVIRGRLSDSKGVGVRGARIELLTAIESRSGAPLDKGGARTRGDGRFTLILPRNVSSRTLVLRYRSHANDTVAVAERTLRLNVRAGVRLSVSPHVAARGRAVTLRGRLVGRPLPRGGKVVELQARSPGKAWITFRTIRAKRSGRFATRYKFRLGGPAVYLMRARVRAADDYPYATGASHAVRVRVR